MSVKYFCFCDANGNLVEIPLDEKPKPLSEEESKEFFEVVHKALKQMEYNFRNPRYYSKEEINKFAEELREMLTKPVDEEKMKEYFEDTNSGNKLSDDQVLTISWDTRHTTAGEVRAKVKKFWDKFADNHAPAQTVESMWNRYIDYATLGKEEVNRQFEIRCFSSCGYARAHDYSYQCWYCKFDLEYLIDKLNLDIEKEPEEHKKNLNEILEGYTH